MAISSCTSCGGSQTNHESYMNALKEAALQRQQQEPVAVPPVPVQPAQPTSAILDIRA